MYPQMSLDIIFFMVLTIGMLLIVPFGKYHIYSSLKYKKWLIHEWFNKTNTNVKLPSYCIYFQFI